jgi:hypothetical protein
MEETHVRVATENLHGTDQDTHPESDDPNGCSPACPLMRPTARAYSHLCIPIGYSTTWRQHCFHDDLQNLIVKLPHFTLEFPRTTR